MLEEVFDSEDFLMNKEVLVKELLFSIFIILKPNWTLQ